MATLSDKFALENVLSVVSAFWIFVSGGFLRVFAKFSRISPARSRIVANERLDDRNVAESEISSCDYGLRSFSEVERSSDSSSRCHPVANKYEVLTSNSFCGYIEEPLSTNFKVQELFANQELEEQGRIADPFCSDATLDGDFHEIDDDKNSLDESVVDRELEEQGRIKELFPFDANLDEDFHETDGFRIVDDDQVEKEGYDCCELSLDEAVSVEEMMNFDRDGLFGMSEIVESSDEFKLSMENQLVSCDQVDQERMMPINDFWHTNGEFISCLDPSGDDISSDDHQKAYKDDEEKSRGSDEEDEVEFDVVLQHKLLVEKMKKEMKHSRVVGLPTILEDLESPRMGDDLKPLRIDQRAGFKEKLDEIQRFYKSYLDKMKRLDILSHQTMYALGFVQLRNQYQPTVNKKQSLPSVKSLLVNNSFWTSKFGRHESDPIQKLWRDLHGDLELVYVGQLCLSWEILKWQHSNVEELQLFDLVGSRHFSAAAEEFQQFQVLVQRFIEDEPFQESPRVELYVKSRCANCSLLQVPPVKDDSKKVERKGEGRVLVSAGRLGDLIEESMHAFWEFLRGDKKEGGNVGFLDHLDSELKSQIRSSLAKKERRLKELIRREKWVTKKSQKQRDFRLTRELTLARVELRLVSRVFSMSRLTLEQLKWCQTKLSKIILDGANVSVESSFLLFPC